MTQRRSWLGALHDRVETLFLWLSYAALFAMTMLTTIDAFLRYFLNAPLEGVQLTLDASNTQFIAFMRSQSSVKVPCSRMRA